MSEKSSFQKKSRVRVLQIPGTKASIQNNQLLVSSGIPSLDHVLGGGVAVGTLLLLEEDVYANYSKLMVKYFLAEGVLSKHQLFIASADDRPEQLITDLPAPVGEDPEKVDQRRKSQEATGDDRMKIAWRYENIAEKTSLPSNIGHYFDLSKRMDADIIDSCAKSFSYVHDKEDGACSDGLLHEDYAKVLEDIQGSIASGNFSTSSAVKDRNVLRLVLPGLGSPCWGEDNDPSLPRFMYALKALLRSSFAVCLVTMPMHLLDDPGFVSRVESFADYVVHLESFAGSEKEKNPVYKEYSGLLNLRKLPRLNALTCHMPETLDLAFKLKRKKFMIEKLHLPPDLSETVSRSQAEKSTIKSTSCSATTAQKLDF